MTPSVRQNLVGELWRRRQAHQLFLDKNQTKWYEDFIKTESYTSTVWLIGRQVGKSWAAVFLAFDECLSNNNHIVQYCSRTKESAAKIVGPAMKAFMDSLPENMRPVKGNTEYEYRFPTTGSIFRIFGTDAQSFSKGRGPISHLILLDECGFFQDLPGILNALQPTLTTTRGKILFLSTPPESIAHPYAETIKNHKISGQIQHATLYDNPRINHEDLIKAEAKNQGMAPEDFINSTYFKREYLAELVQEESRAGFPALTIEARQQITSTHSLPTYFDGYTAMDIGLKSDPHAAVFAIHDWATDEVYFIDELIVPSATTTIKQFAEMVKKKEIQLYGERRWAGTIAGAENWAKDNGPLPFYFTPDILKSIPSQPYLRVVDDNNGSAKEMSIEAQLYTIPTPKSDVELQVDRLNNAIATRKIKIHARCTNLLAQLSGATWDSNRKTWIRLGGHHFDLAQAAVYLYRSVRFNRSAYLPNRINTHTTFVSPSNNQQELQKESLMNAFAPRRKN